MFGSSGRRSKSIRRSRRIGRRGGKSSRLRSLNFGAILKISGIVVAAAALVLVIIFVIVPLLGGKSITPVAQVSPTPSVTFTPIATEDMSATAEELSAITSNSINDPYIFGSQIVFSTGDNTKTSPTLDTIAIYDMSTQQTTNVEGITKKYDQLYEPKIDDKYMVYLDCKTPDVSKNAYGGAVCGYDRSTKKQFVMREYLYGKPKVTLSGDYALWLQQTNNGTDKLYLYYLPTEECTTIEVFVNAPFFISAPYMSDDSIIYVQPKDQNKVVDTNTSSSLTDVQICIIPLKNKGDAERVFYIPGTYVYEPLIKGNDIVYLDGDRDYNSNLMYCSKSGDSFTQPVAIAQGVLNYYIGDGFVVYTKDDAVFIYYFKDGSTGTLSSGTTRALLAGTNGKDVIWYDITGSAVDTTAPDVLMHILVP